MRTLQARLVRQLRIVRRFGRNQQVLLGLDPVALLRLPAVFLRFPIMIETNPIHSQIADLRDRVESLRGYL